MKAKYFQKGATLDYKNDTNNVIEADTVVAIKTRIGVVGAPINPGETGSLHVEGVFELPKASALKIDMGETVYFDGSVINKTPTDNTLAGYAAANAAAASGVVLVKIG